MAAGLGFKTFTTGEVLTAADTNGYLMQGVLVFASAAARDAAITSPQEGQFAYLKDTNVTTYYTGSAWTNLDTTGMTNPMTTTGDMVYSSSGSTPARLGIGTTGQVVTVAGGIPSWATPSTGSMTKILSATFTSVADTGTTFDGVFSSTYNNYMIVMSNLTGSDNADLRFRLRKSGPTTQTTFYYGAIMQNSTLTTQSNTAQFKLMLLSTESAGLTMTLYRDATPTSWSFNGFQRYTNNMVSGACMNDGVGANGATGFILSADGGNISGFAAVYGLAD